ncbi:MAG: hypothetical protein AAF892_04505 [Cyanobacteria bacterium P01_D01_bin.71]
MQNFRRFLGSSRYFVIGAMATGLALAFTSDVQAAAGAGGSGNALSAGTILFIVIGTVVSILYIKAMLTVLHEAADSYSEDEAESAGSYYAAPAWGAAIAGVLAALVIWSYGLSPSLLYLGPILAMISPIAILYCLSQDIKNFKVAHSNDQKTSSEKLSGLRG